MLGLVLALALAQAAPDDDECVRGRCRDRARATAGGSFAYFEFAPASGVGMGTACACTTPTGAKGEAMTFTRAGDATCSKQGLATTGIANGDLVVCTANQPRVESSGGVLGLRVEGARTNETLRSSAINNAAYVDTTVGGAAAPTLNGADATTAPDGTTTAEDYTFPATTAAQGSFRLGPTIAAVCNAQVCSHSYFVKGVSGSGTMDVCSWDTATPTCQSCAFVDTSWSRCVITTTEGGNVAIAIGNGSIYNGGTARSSNRVYVWGAQSEVGAYATSYIPTVAAGVTRNAERAYFSRSVATTAGVCSAATHEVPSTTVYAAGSGLYAPLLSQLSGSASGPYMWPYTSGTGTGLSIDGAASTGAPTGWVPGTTNTSAFARYVAGHNGTAWTICKDGTCSSNGVASAWSSPTYPFIKLDAVATSPEAAIWTRVQVDPVFTRCTP